MKEKIDALLTSPDQEIQGDSFLWNALREVEEEIQEKTWNKMMELFGGEIFFSAWEEFSFSNPLGLERKPFEYRLFPAWFVYNWIIDPAFFRPHLSKKIKEDNHHLTPALFCSKILSLFSPLQEELIKAVEKSPFSYHLVLDAGEDKKVLLRDLFLHEERQINESMESRLLKKGSLVFIRFVKFDDQCLVVGHSPYVIPLFCLKDIVLLKENLKKENGGELEESCLVNNAEKMRRLFFHSLKKATAKLSDFNEDGDPYEIHNIHYDLKCSIREAFDALCSLDKKNTSEEIWEAREMDVEGKIRKIRFYCSKELSDDVIATITIFNTKLDVLADSECRAEKVKAKIATKLQKKVVIREEEIFSNQPEE